MVTDFIKNPQESSKLYFHKTKIQDFGSFSQILLLLSNPSVLN
jgi:hypothetical protein